jgi:hypothetical protein
MDPCALASKVVAIVAGAHSHPYFTSAAQFHAGIGCFGDQDPITMAELDNLNLQNQNFSNNPPEAGPDDTDFALAYAPLYLLVPLGGVVKRLPQNLAPETVYP